MSEKVEKHDKKQTSKSVMREINRTKKTLEIRQKRRAELKTEISGLSKQIRELEKLHGTLLQEEMQRKIATTWLKDGKMTDTQIMKLLEVGSQIHDKIDLLDTDEVIKAVLAVRDK